MCARGWSSTREMRANTFRHNDFLGKQRYIRKLPLTPVNRREAKHMDASNFERTLRACQRRTPFQPFTVTLVNGDRFQVDHPEALVLRDGVAVFIAAGGVPTLFDRESVSQVIAEPLPRQSA